MKFEVEIIRITEDEMTESQRRAAAELYKMLSESVRASQKQNSKGTENTGTPLKKAGREKRAQQHKKDK